MNRIYKITLKTFISLALLFFAAQLTSTQAQPQETSIQFTETEKQWLLAHPVIRISPDSYYEPVEFVEDGVHTGMTGEYFDSISDMLGVTFELIQHEKWSDTLKAMDAGHIDLLTSLQKTPERNLKYNFTVPYISLNSVMVTDRLNKNNKMTMDDLTGKKLAVVEGYFWGDLIKRDYTEIELVSVPDISEGLKQTALGTADAFLGSFATLSYYLNKQEITNLMVAGNSPYQINYGVAIRKDWPELVGILDKAIQAISLERHEQIRANWIKLDYEPPLLNRSVTMILVALVVIAALLAVMGAYISNTLRRKVRGKTKELYLINQKLEEMVEMRTEDLRRANDKLLSTKRLLTSTNKTLEEEANRDRLTKIPNRKRLEEVLELTMKEVQTAKNPISLMMMDIDHFKLLNDHYGHLIGDDCLIEVASCLNSFTKRGGEFVARFGGEEFIMVLPNIDEEQATNYANSVLEKTHELSIENIDSPTEKFVTLSIGVATYSPLDEQLTSAELINRSDLAMYQAKKSGRNQVVAYSSL